MAIGNVLTLGFNLYGLYGVTIATGIFIILKALLWYSTKRYLPHITREIEAKSALPGAPRTPTSFVFLAIFTALLLAILIPGCAAFYKGLSEGMENARAERERSQ